MRNSDIASFSSVKRFLLYFYMFFILVYETTKWYKRSHDKKQYHQIILGISILFNGEGWCKTWFIRREVKMTPVISRHI